MVRKKKDFDNPSLFFMKLEKSMKKLLIAAMISCFSMAAMADAPKNVNIGCTFRVFYSLNSFAIYNGIRISQVESRDLKVYVYSSDEKFHWELASKEEVNFVMNQVYKVMKNCDGDVVMPKALGGKLPALKPEPMNAPNITAADGVKLY